MSLRNRSIVLCAMLLCGLFVALPAVAAGKAETPPQLVETYESLADAILAAKKTEWNLVHSILATTYSHAEGAVASAKAKMAQGADAKGEMETAAALVSQLANEGDASVAAVRKRLVEGGHHHHAGGESQGVYDEGFVIVTREAKKALLDAAKKIGRAKDAAALDAAWNEVVAQFKGLHETTGG